MAVVAAPANLGALSIWFQERVQSNGGKMRKTTIVALALKLLVALWKYSASEGVVIEGAAMKTSSDRRRSNTNPPIPRT